MTALLVIIYIAFISLGLPDSMLGAAWPIMHVDLGAPLSFAGVVSMITSCGIVVSSLFSTKAIQRFGVGKVTAASVAMTAIALLCIAFAPSIGWICLWAIPLGLGAGSVDAGLNNFVALHYQAQHMSWLHCFWGLGATMGPLVMAFWLRRDGDWPSGYLTVGLLQAALVTALVISLPLWKKASHPSETSGEEEPVEALPLRKVFQVPYAKAVLLSFFCYCTVEATTYLWASSYAVAGFGVEENTAAGWNSLFFVGITLGRFLSGFVAMKISGTAMIRIGQTFIVGGILLLLLPLPLGRIPVGLCLVGIGCAPIFPAMLHQTPKIFGEQRSQAMMGVQMACAYVGTTLMPPVFGWLSSLLDIRLLPVFLLLFVIVMVFGTEKVAMVGRGQKD